MMTASITLQKPTHFLAVLPRDIVINNLLPMLPSRDLRAVSQTCHAGYQVAEVEQEARVAKWVGIAVIALPPLPENTSWTRLAGGMSNMNEHKKRNDGDIPSMLIASKYLEPLFEFDLEKWLNNIPVGKEAGYERFAQEMRSVKRKQDDGYVPHRLTSREANARRWQTMWGNRPGAIEVAEDEKYRIMETLDGSDCGLESVPAVAIACLRNVMRVNLNNNAFTEVPEALFRLPVYELQIEHNLIEKLPENFHRFSILARLAVSGNPLEYVPDSVKRMSLRAIAIGVGQWELFRGMIGVRSIGNMLRGTDYIIRLASSPEGTAM